MANDTAENPSPTDISFEDALQALQGIVESLESGSLGLEESLARFEEGIGLLGTCNNVLGQAEQRIETLTGVDSNGNPITEPLDNEATIDKQPDADDASLF
jgi:exodeoxyribonuclease VII small subunit